MNIKIDSNKCKKSLSCTMVCSMGHLYENNGSPKVDNDKECILCLQCVSSCKYGAVKSNGIPVTIIPEEEASLGPRDERLFTVVSDEDIIQGLRSEILKMVKRYKSLFNLFRRVFFFHPKKKKNFEHLYSIFNLQYKENEIKDKIFKEAPHLLLVSAPKTNTGGKDNCMYAINSFMTIAEEYKVGTCIVGFLSGFHKKVAKYLQIPDSHIIHAGIVFGYPKISYAFAAYRNAAQDISQEVLIKIVTKLSAFQKKSSLKTWILRITINHIISQKRKVREYIFSDFPSHNELLEGLGDQIPDREIGPDDRVISDEMKNQCVEGMLLCLDRDQRSTFIIGAIMGIGSKEGAKALDISEDAFRKRLSRARKDLSQYMNDQCGLVNAENSCRCARKAKAALEAGYFTDDMAVFNKKRLDEVSQFIQSSGNDADTLLDRVSEVHRQVPVMELGGAKIKQVILGIKFIIGFHILNILFWAIGQGGAVIDYDTVADWGLQEARDTIDPALVAINRGIGFADVIIGVPLFIIAAIGLWRLRFYGAIFSWMVFGIGFYWTAVAWSKQHFLLQASVKCQPFAIPVFGLLTFVFLFSVWASWYLYKNRSLLLK